MTTWVERKFDLGLGDKLETTKRVGPKGPPLTKCACGMKVIFAFDIRKQHQIVRLHPEAGSNLLGDDAFILTIKKKPVAWPARDTDPESMRYRLHRCTAFGQDGSER